MKTKQQREMFIQISSRYFCAGVVLLDGVVIATAPILKYMNGWSLNAVRCYIVRKGWKGSPCIYAAPRYLTQ